MMNPRRRLPVISFLALFITTALFFLLPAWGAGTTDADVVPCEDTENNVDAWVFDTDPAGTNVRSGPGTNYDVLTTLPADRTVVVKITGSVGEWIRISEAWVCNETEITTVHLVGWVHGSLLKVMVIGQRDPSGLAPLYAEPNTDSPIVARIPQDTLVTIAGCRGGWMKVRYREVEGWLSPGFQNIMEEYCYLVIADAGRHGGWTGRLPSILRPDLH